MQIKISIIFLLTTSFLFGQIDTIVVNENSYKIVLDDILSELTLVPYCKKGLYVDSFFSRIQVTVKDGEVYDSKTISSNIDSHATHLVYFFNKDSLIEVFKEYKEIFKNDSFFLIVDCKHKNRCIYRKAKNLTWTEKPNHNKKKKRKCKKRKSGVPPQK